MPRTTIKKAVSCKGIGLHTGSEAYLEFRPATPGSGVVFIHKDQKIPATVDFVSSTIRGTCLSTISTVEHVLSAVKGLSIDDIEILLQGDEPPALDGSSSGFVEILIASGIEQRPGNPKILSPDKIIIVEDGDSKISALPHDRLSIEATIDYSPSFIGRVSASYDERVDDYSSAIASARTFGFMSELEGLKKAGLARGASVDNAIAVLEDGYSSPLRFPDELARHKILDIIGDIALTGARVNARIVSFKAGHKLNVELARRLINASS